MQQDFNKMMRDAQKSLQKMQEDMAKVQEELAATTVTGSAGGGAVTVTCTGASEFTSVKLKPEAVDPEDIETLEDLILAAVKDASQKAQALMSEKTGGIARGLKLPPGLGF
jgi:hypothetical protein